MRIFLEQSNFALSWYLSPIDRFPRYKLSRCSSFLLLQRGSHKCTCMARFQSISHCQIVHLRSPCYKTCDWDAYWCWSQHLWLFSSSIDIHYFGRDLLLEKWTLDSLRRRFWRLTHPHHWRQTFCWNTWKRVRHISNWFSWHSSLWSWLSHWKSPSF